MRHARGLAAFGGGPFILLAGLWLVAWSCLWASPAAAQQSARVGLVVGQTNYETGALPTTGNDAGLVVQTLRSAGFDVVEGADLELDGLRRSVREFMDKVEAAGPQAEAVVYWTGHGVQFEGENWFVPVGARINRASDIPIESFRVADLVRSLAALPARARIVHPRRLASVPRVARQPAARPRPDPDRAAGRLRHWLFRRARPIAPDGQGPYGPYANALVEMIAEPGLSLDELFGRVRVRVHEVTQGRQTPWDSIRLSQPFAFFAAREDAAIAPPPAPVRPRRIRRSAAGGGLRAGPRARHHRRLPGIPADLSKRRFVQPHQAHPGPPPRSGGVAAHSRAELA